MGRAPPRRPLGQSTLGRRGLRRPRQACPCSSPKASLPRAMGPTPRRRDGVGARARARAAAQGRAPQGAVRRVPAGTPENRARPPREGPAGVSGLPPPREGKQGGWGTEAWNPVTWSSSGQIVLCETGEKEPLGGPAAALSPRVSGACPAGRRGPRSRPWGCRLAPPAAPASQFSDCLFSYGHNTQPGAPARVQWSSGNSSSSALSGEWSRVRPSDHVPCPGPRPWLSLLLLSLSR